MTGYAYDDPVVTYHVREGWVTVYDWSIQTPDAGLVVIFAGFGFDLASVPRVFWVLLAPFELGITGPLLHDHGYREHWADRRTVDRMFRDIQLLEGVGWVRRWVTWGAVRVFGWFAWR